MSLTMPRFHIARWFITTFLGLLALAFWFRDPPETLSHTWAVFDRTAYSRESFTTATKQHTLSSDRSDGDEFAAEYEIIEH